MVHLPIKPNISYHHPLLNPPLQLDFPTLLTALDDILSKRTHLRLKIHHVDGQLSVNELVRFLYQVCLNVYGCMGVWVYGCYVLYCYTYNVLMVAVPPSSCTFFLLSSSPPLLLSSSTIYQVQHRLASDALEKLAVTPTPGLKKIRLSNFLDR
jgi:hypothetical protein